MAGEEKKAIMRRWFAEMVQGDLSQLDEFIAKDYVRHEATTAGAQGREGYKQALLMLRAAFSNFDVTIDDMIAEDDRIAVRYTTRATHTGEFMGVAPTARPVTIAAIAIVRFAGGIAVESWANLDMLGLLQQIDAAPTTG